MHPCTLRRIAVPLLTIIAGAWMPDRAVANTGACLAPAPVCASRSAVFRIESFSPFASAVRIADSLLVTNRHVVADANEVAVYVAGKKRTASVLPSSFDGDLVLLQVTLPAGPTMLPASQRVRRGDTVRTVGYDLSQRQIRVYLEGRVISPPADGYALARLHHTAHTQPGNSGGAVVNDAGELVGIATSGGAGIFEAVSVQRIDAVRAASGGGHADRHRRLSAAYRSCTFATEAAQRARGRVPFRLAA
ncbi:MAG: serine protease, partial [Pseudomonadota bacterium]